MKQTYIINYKECSLCKKRTDTRALSIRWQDFLKTYQTREGKTERNLYFYHTRNYVLCRKCQKEYTKKLK